MGLFQSGLTRIASVCAFYFSLALHHIKASILSRSIFSKFFALID